MPILTPQSFSLDFIGEGSEHPVLRQYQISQQDKKELMEKVEAVWKKVMNLDFTKL
jgi:hypothetical protein